MIGYVTLGSNDRVKAGKFYDELLALIGARRAMEDGDRFIGWSNGKGAMVAIARPFDGHAATIGNGSMVALAMDSRASVDAIHAKALALGGKDEGPVGLRGGNFYAGYFRDLDGNKLCAYYMGG